MGVAEAAEFAGVPARTAAKWSAGRCRTAPPARALPAVGARMAPRNREGAPAMDQRRPGSTARPEGPLSGLTPDQVENLLLRAVLADLKAGGWDPASMPNRSKCELGERLRAATGQPLARSPASWGCRRALRVPQGPPRRDRDADTPGWVVRLFREGRGSWGYRTIWARRAAGTRASESACGASCARRAWRSSTAGGAGAATAPTPARSPPRRPTWSRQALPGVGPRRAVAHRHHRVRAALRPEGLPEPRRRLLRRQAGGVSVGPARRPSWPTPPCSRPSRRGAREPARPSTRPRRALPLAGGGSPSARSTAWSGACRPKGAAGQLGLRGVLRAPQERVLLPPRLEGRRRRGVHPAPEEYLEYYREGGASSARWAG